MAPPAHHIPLVARRLLGWVRRGFGGLWEESSVLWCHLSPDCFVRPAQAWRVRGRPAVLCLGSIAEETHSLAFWSSTVRNSPQFAQAAVVEQRPLSRRATPARPPAHHTHLHNLGHHACRLRCAGLPRSSRLLPGAAGRHHVLPLPPSHHRAGLCRRHVPAGPGAPRGAPSAGDRRGAQRGRGAAGGGDRGGVLADAAAVPHVGGFRVKSILEYHPRMGAGGALGELAREVGVCFGVHMCFRRGLCMEVES